MNASQIGALVLAKCAAHDPWFPNGGEAIALAWGTIFARHKLALDDLLAAVEVAYGVNGAGFKPLPADIAKAAREIRRDRAEREPEADRQARIAAQDARPEVAAAMHDPIAAQRRTAIAEFAARTEKSSSGPLTAREARSGTGRPERHETAPTVPPGGSNAPTGRG